VRRGRRRPGPGHEALTVEQPRYEQVSAAVDDKKRAGQRGSDRERRLDHLERHQRSQGDRRQAAEYPQLLRDADVAGSRRDGQADPDRPAGQQRDEDCLGGHGRRLPHGGGDHRTGAQPDDGQEDTEHQVGEPDRGQEDRGRLADQEFLPADRRGQHRLEGALLALADHGERSHRRGHEDRDQQQV
jgi:hypothetical protein